MRKQTSMRLVAVSTMSAVLSCLMYLANAQSLVWLGTLPYPYNKWSIAWGVSRGGSFVVGFSGDNPCPLGKVCSHAFYWIAPRGPMFDLNPGDDVTSVAWDISGDGVIVVGAIFYFYGDYSTSHAVRWRSFQVEELWPGSDVCCSEAYGVSLDGVFAAGWYDPPDDGQPYSLPARWRNVQLDGLIPFEGEARDTSENGLVTVGWARSTDTKRAFKWYRNGGVEWLEPLPGYQHSAAYAVSADGSVVVGLSYNTLPDGSTCVDGRATRWIAGQVQDLGVLPDYPAVSVAFDVSADGSIVVGMSGSCPDSPFFSGRAFRWTESAGMQDLNVIYASLLTEGSVLWSANAISPEGCYIVGVGSNSEADGEPRQIFGEAFWLHASCVPRNGDVNGDGCVDDADLLAVLFAFGQSCPACPSCLEDLNCDGTVDDADLLIVLFNFGNGC